MTLPILKGLKQVLGLPENRQKTKIKVGEAAAGAKARPTTRMPQTSDQVCLLLGEDGARRIGIQGDRGFRDQFAASLDPGRVAGWFSVDASDLAAGADLPSVRGYAGLDALVVGGRDFELGFRQALRIMQKCNASTPVHYIGDFEFCGGTLAIPAEADGCLALLYNHFQQFFNQRDVLQFRIEAADDDRRVRRWRLLGPNQSMILDIDELLPDRRGPSMVKVLVSHPLLTGGRHYRLRLCADVEWRRSFTIVHGSHQFFKSPDKRKEFRLAEEVLRGGHTVVTVPNYDLDMGENPMVDLLAGTERHQIERRRDRRVTEIRFEHRPGRANARRHFGLGYNGFGTSFWYAFEEGIAGPGGPVDSLAGNHLCRVRIEDRQDAALSPEESARLEMVEASGFMIHPCTVPILRGRDGLAFGFNYGASNPPVRDFDIRFFDAAGSHLGRVLWRTERAGPVLIEDVLADWADPAAEQAAVALVAPDWRKIGYAPGRVVTAADLVLQSIHTGDRDLTEFQSSWRNLGMQIPDLPHWLHPSIGVFGRTNVIGRARTRDGHRTGVLLANASGNLGYRRQVNAQIQVLDLAGKALRADIPLAAFTAKLVWLDELLPGLDAHLGAAGMGPLVVTCGEADLGAQVISVNPAGAVGLQHLWGY
ncbi:MAG: hypothetical protein KIT81_08465 [Alphaproteobacteria bacterium]|nr:hypothetical protein [Alphaproteobacteria bacterium]